jgi:toxin ParE1/3/4
MARFRLARPAQIDLASILATGAERWGTDGRQRYAAVLADAIRQVADEPEGPLTKKRTELRSGIHGFHIRHARRASDAAKVRRPVHVLYYRVAREGVIEIVRVLHEKMDPSRHFQEPPTEDGV